MREAVDHHDAELLLKLYDLRREEVLRRARQWFSQELRAKNLEEFNKACPPGSDANAWFRMVVTYWEMAANIVNHGLIQSEFFFESTSEFFMVWEKIKAVVPALRETRKNPHMWENLESLAAEYAKWMKKRAPGALENWRERIAAMTKKD